MRYNTLASVAFATLGALTLAAPAVKAMPLAQPAHSNVTRVDWDDYRNNRYGYGSRNEEYYEHHPRYRDRDEYEERGEYRGRGRYGRNWDRDEYREERGEYGNQRYGRNSDRD